MTVFIIVALMLLGVLGGYFLRPTESVLRILGRAVSVILYLLLFTLGVSLGVQRELVAQLGRLGWQSLVFAFCATGVSVLCAWGLARHLKLTCDSEREEGQPTGILSVLLGSGSYLLAFVIGVLAGYFQWLPSGLGSADIATYIIYGLMVVVGLSVGGDRATLARIRHLDPRLLFVPILTAFASFAGGALAGWMLPGFSLGESAAVGSGYGYYSLSSVIIAESDLPVSRASLVAMVALVSNIAREILTILLAGPLARLFGPLAPIAAGGATSMDTSLPFVVRASGVSYSVVSIYHGVFLTLLCPFAVSLCLQI